MLAAGTFQPRITQSGSAATEVLNRGSAYAEATARQVTRHGESVRMADADTGEENNPLSLSLQSVKSALATAEPVPRRRRVIRGWKVPAASMSYEPLAGRESSHF